MKQPNSLVAPGNAVGSKSGAEWTIAIEAVKSV